VADVGVNPGLDPPKPAAAKVSDAAQPPPAVTPQQQDAPAPQDAAARTPDGAEVAA
jgi:hypothetical protein